MITQAADIEEKQGWDGVSNDPYVLSPVLNLDSNMNLKEHQRIVYNARHLLAGELALDDKSDTPAGRALKLLQQAYNTNDLANAVLKISKGIHQPETNPHMQLTLVYGTTNYLYHLDVSVSDTPIEGLPDYFHWVGVQFSSKIGQTTACWPLNAVRTTKFKLRRRSIAPECVLGKIEAIAKFEREEKERQEAEEKRRQEQSAMTVKGNDVKEKLASGGYKLADFRNGLKNLIGGATVEAKFTSVKKVTTTVNIKLVNGNIVRV
jgi:hypothetical protein